jgi:hypothetical protein
LYIIIKNTSESDSVILSTSSPMMEMLGCDSVNTPKTININKGESYFFNHQCDITKLLPKILSFRVSFLCSMASKSQLDEETHVIFFDRDKDHSKRVFNFDETYKHAQGIFNYIRVDIANPLKYDFSFNSDIIHSSIVIKKK